MAGKFAGSFHRILIRWWESAIRLFSPLRNQQGWLGLFRSACHPFYFNMGGLARFTVSFSDLIFVSEAPALVVVDKAQLPLPQLVDYWSGLARLS